MAVPKSKTYKAQSFDHLVGLDGISDAQITEHLKLYEGYVKQDNTLNEQIAEMLGRGKASGANPEFAEIARRLGFEYNGMILHEMRGVGWVILFEDPVTDRLSNHWITLHQEGIPAGFKPLLVMDVWEHAFMRDYKATERKKYVEAFFRNIDWALVDRRLQREASLRPAAA
jgi:superoxide dismutase, Fe-Mn family